MTRRILTDSDLEKAAAFIKRIGAQPVAVEVTPGRISVTLAGGEQLTVSPDEQFNRLTNFPRLSRQ